MPLAIDPTLDAFSVHMADLRQLSPHTVRAYRADIRAFVAYLAGSQRSSVLKVDAATARSWIGHMTKVDGLAKASIARRVASLRTFFTWAIQSGLADSNPFTDVDIPKRGKSLPKALDASDIGAILDSNTEDSPAGLRDKAIVECLYASGIRAGELIGLDLEDVFRTGTDEGALRIRHAKGGQERYALLGKHALRALHIYIKDARETLLAAAGSGTTDALFLNRFGGRLSDRAIRRLFDRLGKSGKVGVKPTPHMMRHSFASHLLENGADIRVVQELLGHKDLSSTQIYTRIRPKQLKDVHAAHFEDK
jgi:site-specific recombinase XerD